jgi:hypothetical protein
VHGTRTAYALHRLKNVYRVRIPAYPTA